MPAQKIFLSYSRVDGMTFAQKLSADLTNHGLDVWRDQEDIRAGHQWDLEIEKAIDACDYLLFLESERSVESTHVLDEVYYALGEGKTVIPVIVKDSKTPYRLQRLQHIDFTQDYNNGLQQLFAALQTPANSHLSPVASTVGPAWKRKLFIPGALLLIICITAILIFFYSRKKSPEEPVTEPAGEEWVVQAEKIKGRWRLTAVEPAPRLQNGQLVIEAVDAGRVNINSSLQFYYFKTNDTVYLSVFNGFAGCKNCTPQKNMKLITEDVAIGWQQFKILTQNTTEGKKGDTAMDRGGNQSLAAASSLQFMNDSTATITVQSSKVTEFSPSLTLQPFTYVFRFAKTN